MTDDQGMHKCPGCGGWGRNGQSCRPCRDTDHAVALEREAVVNALLKWANGSASARDYEKSKALYDAAQAIRNGDHWEAGR